MKVVITDAAEADFEEIGLYIAKDSPLRALTLVDDMIEAAHRIGTHPKAYPLIPRYEDRGYRRRPFGSYLIIYAVREDHVTIERVFHGAQDYEPILFPDD